jgi:hypothetical protein
MSGTPTVSTTKATDAALDAVRDFFRDKPLVFVGTGMSCALDVRFGMPALRDELLKTVAVDSHSSTQSEEWHRVRQSLADGHDLESSLNHVADPDLLRTITSETARFIASLDREYAFQIAGGTKTWPASRLLERLVEALPEGDPVLHVVTPNYDLLLEHACDYAKLSYTAGFCGGVERCSDWGAVEHCLVARDRVIHRRRFETRFKPRKHIRLHKVHGSLDFFFHRGKVIQNHAWMWAPPDFAQRVMITPGISKFATLQAYRQELLKAADSAIEKATQFLFLGYGFNDKHLEEYIFRKLITQSCKGLIVTRSTNARIETLLTEAPRLWLVSHSTDGSTDGTRIKNRATNTDLFLPKQQLWDIGTFAAELLGV